jgi:hypothetical protein
MCINSSSCRVRLEAIAKRRIASPKFNTTPTTHDGWKATNPIALSNTRSRRRWVQIHWPLLVAEAWTMRNNCEAAGKVSALFESRRDADHTTLCPASLRFAYKGVRL